MNLQKRESKQTGVQTAGIPLESPCCDLLNYSGGISRSLLSGASV